MEPSLDHRSHGFADSGRWQNHSLGGRLHTAQTSILMELCLAACERYHFDERHKPTEQHYQWMDKLLYVGMHARVINHLDSNHVTKFGR